MNVDAGLVLMRKVLGRPDEPADGE